MLRAVCPAKGPISAQLARVYAELPVAMKPGNFAFGTKESYVATMSWQLL